MICNHTGKERDTASSSQPYCHNPHKMQSVIWSITGGANFCKKKGSRSSIIDSSVKAFTCYIRIKGPSL